MASLEAMCRHVDGLLMPYDDVRIYWLPRAHGACVIRVLDSGEVLEIRLPRIRSIISYAVALHEIGHIRGRYQRSRNVMVRERWAWQWARKNALFWSPAVERVAAKALFDAKANEAWLALCKKARR